MDNIDFKLTEEKEEKKDIYFANEESINDSPSSKPAASKSPSKKKRKKGSGIGSTYMFFIFVIAASMVISIYAIFCMNDILAITKTTSTKTISFTQSVETSDEAIDTLADNGLIKCKYFCKFFVKLRDKVITSSHLGGPYEAGVYYLNGKMGLEGMLMTLKGNDVSSETVTLTFPEGFTVDQIVERLVKYHAQRPCHDTVTIVAGDIDKLNVLGGKDRVMQVFHLIINGHTHSLPLET